MISESAFEGSEAVVCRSILMNGFIWRWESCKVPVRAN